MDVPGLPERPCRPLELRGNDLWDYEYQGTPKLNLGDGKDCSHGVTVQNCSLSTISQLLQSGHYTHCELAGQGSMSVIGI